MAAKQSNLIVGNKLYEKIEIQELIEAKSERSALKKRDESSDAWINYKVILVDQNV